MRPVHSVSFTHLRQEIKGRTPPTVSDRTGRFRPAIPALRPEISSGGKLPPGQSQFAVAEARSTLTPGPMVEDSETFFR